MPLVNRLGLDLLLFSLVEMWTIKVMLSLKRANIQIPIAVNASAKTICTPNFADRLAARMRQAELPNRLLKIELTEDVPEPNELHLSASLTAIRAKGFQVSMDDFGTGAATFALLANLSFDEMKIDGSFVRGVEQHSSSRNVIAGIVNWARLLNLSLVAEGSRMSRRSRCCTVWAAGSDKAMPWRGQWKSMLPQLCDSTEQSRYIAG